MKKIVFVCWGNICRSPMAEFVMKDKVKKAGLEDFFEIDSRATSREEEGNGIHYGTRRVLDDKNIPYTRHYATVITRAEYDYYDIIVSMDDINTRRLKNLFDGDPKNKVRPMLPSRDVADPWYTGNFEVTYRDVDYGCEELLRELTEKN